METAYLPVFAALPADATTGNRIHARGAASLRVQWHYDGPGRLDRRRSAVMQRAANAGQYHRCRLHPFITDLDEVLKTNPVATFGATRTG